MQGLRQWRNGIALELAALASVCAAAGVTVNGSFSDEVRELMRGPGSDSTPIDVGDYADLVHGDDLGAMNIGGVDIGKLAKHHGVPIHQAASLAAALHQANQPRMHETPPRVMGRRSIGVAQSIGGNATATVNMLPQCYLSVRELVYTGPASTFTINDVQVLTHSMFAAPGPQAADVYVPGSFHSSVQWKTTSPNVPYQILVTNLTNNAAIFGITFFGEAADA